MLLASLLSEFAPGDLDYSFFVNSGSEATELAFRVALQYWREKGKPQKTRMISRWTSYHGSTMGALSMTGAVGRRSTYTPVLEHYPVVAPPYCYQCPLEKSYPGCNSFCARELETAILRAGPDNVAGFIAEPFAGSSGAAFYPPPEYFSIVREICDKYDVLMIADEVMTGFGRTGRNFAIEHWGVVPDVIAFGKGVTSGYAPLAGCIISSSIYKTIQEGSGVFALGHTFSGNPLSTAVGLRVVQYLYEHRLVDRSREMGEGLGDKLQRLAAQHPIIGNVRGKGLFWGVEFVRDRSTHEAFPFGANIAGQVVDEAFGQGLMVYPARGAQDGAAGDAIIIAPPLTITETELDELLSLLDSTLARVEARAKW